MTHNKLYWKLRFAKRQRAVDPIDEKMDLVLEYKIVEGIVYVLREYEVFHRLDDFQNALFNRLREPIVKALFQERPLIRFAKGE